MSIHANNYTFAYNKVNANSCFTSDYSLLHTEKMEFKDWLRAKIDENQLKETQLADLTLANGEPVPQATINRILNGVTKDPRKSTVDALVRALGGNPDLWLDASMTKVMLANPEVSVVRDQIMDDFYSLPTEDQALLRSQIQAVASKNRAAQAEKAEKAEMKAMMQALLNSQRPWPTVPSGTTEFSRETSEIYPPVQETKSIIVTKNQ